MKTAAAILVLLLATSLAGCANTSYVHDDYADGKLVRHIEVDDLRNAYDTKAASATLTLSDGTTITLSAASGQVDPNAVAAAQAWGEAALTAAGTIAKLFVGVP